MNQVKPGLGGRGTVTVIESKRHPKSHFEPHDLRIERADDGSYVLRHGMRLKKKYENSENFHGSHMDDETRTAKDGKELMSHILKHFGGSKAAKASAEAEPDAEAAAEAEEE